VRLPSWLGDLVACEPALRALAHRLGCAEGSGLSLVAPRQLLPILDGILPGARRIPQEGRSAECAADWRGHDVAILFTNSFRSAWTAWRAGIPRRVGWARDGRRFLLTDSITPALERGGLPLGLGLKGTGRRVLPRPFGATCIELANLVGAEVRDRWPRVTAGEWPDSLASWEHRDGEFLLVNAGCRPGSTKGIPPELLGQALRGVAALEIPILIVGGPGEEAAVNAVLEAAGPLDVPLHAALPEAPSLPELSALCARARVAWTADAGPLHILRANRTPRVVLQGSTDPRHTAENLQGEIRLRTQVDCGPCHREVCSQPEPQRMRCMGEIDPARLVESTRTLLAVERFDCR
jgi:heptosyltransferase-2